MIVVLRKLNRRWKNNLPFDRLICRLNEMPKRGSLQLVKIITCTVMIYAHIIYGGNEYEPVLIVSPRIFCRFKMT